MTSSKSEHPADSMESGEGGERWDGLVGSSISFHVSLGDVSYNGRPYEFLVSSGPATWRFARQGLGHLGNLKERRLPA